MLGRRHVFALFGTREGFVPILHYHRHKLSTINFRQVSLSLLLLLYLRRHSSSLTYVRIHYIFFPHVRTENVVQVVGQSLGRRPLLQVRPRPPDRPSQHYADADEGPKPARSRVAAVRSARQRASIEATSNPPGV